MKFPGPLLILEGPAAAGAGNGGQPGSGEPRNRWGPARLTDSTASRAHVLLPHKPAYFVLMSPVKFSQGPSHPRNPQWPERLWHCVAGRSVAPIRVQEEATGGIPLQVRTLEAETHGQPLPSGAEVESRPSCAAAGPPEILQEGQVCSVCERTQLDQSKSVFIIVIMTSINNMCLAFFYSLDLVFMFLTTLGC